MVAHRRIGVVKADLLGSSFPFCSYLHFISGVRMFKLLMRLHYFISPAFKTRVGLQAENLALRHQLCVLQRLHHHYEREAA